MKNKRGATISARAATKLLERVAHRLDPELTKEMLCPVYVLEDGGAVIVFEDGKGTHWFSYEELLANHRASVRRAQERRDLLTELLPHPEGFRTQVPAMIAQLPSLLGINPKLLDYSEESLDAVDKAIKRLGSERMMTAEVFPSLLAYVGEVIRRRVRGAWELRSTQDGSRLEPEIVEITGGRHQVLGIYKQLLEYGRTASMRAFVHVALRKHRMSPPH